jgi:hypothetical protein
MILVARNHGVDNTCCRWLRAMLKGRHVQATVFNETLPVSVVRGCPLGGVLSLLLWDLVVDDLLLTLNNQGYYTLGYTDDIVILILEKHANIELELMLRALDVVEGWCLREIYR